MVLSSKLSTHQSTVARRMSVIQVCVKEGIYMGKEKWGGGGGGGQGRGCLFGVCCFPSPGTITHA